MNKNVDWEFSEPIPHLYQSFLVLEYIDDDGLREGICDHFEEVDSILYEVTKILGIPDAELEEQVP